MAKMTTLQVLQGIRDWCDEQLATKQDTISDLSEIRQRISDIEAIIGTADGDSDTVINKVREIIDFFANVPETDTLTNLLAQMNSAINNRYTKEEMNDILEDTPEFVEEDPSETDLVDEYAQLLQTLYQAITDAQNAKADYIGDDFYVYHWDAMQEKYVKTNKYAKGAAGTTDYNDLINKPTIPSTLSQMTEDTTHRVVTDAEKTTWSGKQDSISDLSTIRSNAGLGATAYQKPSTGIPARDMEGGVIRALESGASAYQKPQAGIPTSDLTTAIQSLLTAAGTALQPSDITELTQKVAQLETLVTSDTNGVIDKFNEIVDFLNGIGSTETLEGILSDIATQINTKYVKPQNGIPLSDMEASVAQAITKGSTSVQPNDIANDVEMVVDNTDTFPF